MKIHPQSRRTGERARATRANTRTQQRRRTGAKNMTPGGTLYGITSLLLISAIARTVTQSITTTYTSPDPSSIGTEQTYIPPPEPGTTAEDTEDGSILSSKSPEINIYTMVDPDGSQATSTTAELSFSPETVSSGNVTTSFDVSTAPPNSTTIMTTVTSNTSPAISTEANVDSTTVTVSTPSSIISLGTNATTNIPKSSTSILPSTAIVPSMVMSATSGTYATLLTSTSQGSTRRTTLRSTISLSSIITEHTITNPVTNTTTSTNMSPTSVPNTTLLTSTPNSTTPPPISKADTTISTVTNTSTSDEVTTTTTPLQNGTVGTAVLRLKLTSTLSNNATINAVIQKMCSVLMIQFKIKEFQLTWGQNKMTASC
ncbi:uncharacterized protein ACNLHF_024254 isoform 2-T4 [Anomaloglossus baeobatrachus]|uniref:uncharacterized protein LOC142316896 isoform X2 n=1 Tax=Anomaloglossus baeobatrachus TaxID=238106 RepID=UPI003F50D3A0